MNTRRTQTEQLQDIVNAYIDSGSPWPASAKTVAAWAILTKRWAPQSTNLIAQCADLLARAMRDEYIEDPQGRRVRAKHAARFERAPEQTPLWADIRSASREHMQIAFQQRRQQIVGDCHQLKIDADSYNQNSNPSAPIQLVFDFTRDLRDLEALESRGARASA